MIESINNIIIFKEEIMKKRKITGLILAMILTALLLFACGGDDADNQTRGEQAPGSQEAADSGGTDENEEAPENARDPNFVSDLHDYDFGGYVFHAIGRTLEDDDVGSWNTREIYAEQETGELINDAVYRRNRILEDKYNFEIKQTRFLQGVATNVRRMIAAGDEFDLILPPQRESATLAAEGLLMNLKEVPYLDLTKGYWNQNIERFTAINNSVFFATGDINIMDKQATYVLYFNKEMHQGIGLACPYIMVREGTWTMDAFNLMLRDVTRDLNGDGILNMHDQFGVLVHAGMLNSFNYFAGESIVTRTTDGGLDITFNNERTIRAIDRGIELMTGNDAFSPPGWEEGQNMFEAGQSLFYMEVLDKTGQLRGMEIPFGVLPPPKLDELQEKYYTTVHDHGQFFCIPINTSDESRAGFILEAMAEASTDTLKRAYYDLNLTHKFVRDEDSVEMIELVMQGTIFDIAQIYGVGRLGNIVSSSIMWRENRFASDFEANIDRARAALESFIAAFD
jgi:ABC-type glycerol-3-phosphate transport system substrate-binding protein